jgi:serine/threonine-protein phosphatase 2A regulatory subunit B''
MPENSNQFFSTCYIIQGGNGQQLAHQHSPSAPGDEEGTKNDIILPKLYFPEAVDAMRKHLIERTMDFLAPFRETLSLLGLKTLLRDTFGLPASLAYPLIAKLAPSSPDQSVPTIVLQTWLSSVDFMGKGHPHRALDILRAPDRQYIIPSDFRPIMAGILGSHPGLSFLQDSPEFQDRYAETVVHRIFYALDNSRSGRLTIRDLKK